MCEVSRRGFFAGGMAFLSIAAEAELMAGPTQDRQDPAKVDMVAPGVPIQLLSA